MSLKESLSRLFASQGRILTGVILVVIVLSGVLLRHVASERVILSEDHNNRPVIMVTVPPLAMLVRQVFGAEGVIEVVSDSVDYHAPQYTPRQLQKWLDSDVVIWLGAEQEPQFLPLIRKLNSAGKIRFLDLSQQSATSHEHEVTENEERVNGHHHAHLSAHAWLDWNQVAGWPELIDGAIPYADPKLGENAQLDDRQNNVESFNLALARLLAHWQERFDQLDHRVLVQEHAVFDAFLEPFGIKVVGALSNQHDVAIGAEALSHLKHAIREQEVHCFLAMPGNATVLPAGLFPEPPMTYRIDPLGRRQWVEGADFLQYYENFLVEIYSCLTSAE